MTSLLLVERVDDNSIIERVFLNEIMQKHLTEREHAVLALRASGYTRTAIVQLLGIGKTTVYTCERQAVEKIRNAYRLDMEGEWQQDMDTHALSVDG